jgi:hypothetical protein
MPDPFEGDQRLASSSRSLSQHRIGLDHVNHNLVSASAFLGNPNGHVTSSNAAAVDVPFQRWMKIKEAFSPKFVIEAIASLPFKVSHCIDPFAGSGTTPLVCSSLGIAATAIEVNPFLADLAEAKLTPFPSFALARAYSECLLRANAVRVSTKGLLPNAPRSLCEPGINGRYVFARGVLKRILELRLAIESLEEKATRRLFKVLLGSILVPLSNVVVNGKGRRYRGGGNSDELVETMSMTFSRMP